jgi:hypothetical protein
MSDLAQRLCDLGLRATGAELDDLVARATKERWSPVQLLEHMVDLDERDHAKRSLDRRFTDSHIGRFKPMADFDWAWPTKIDRDMVERALDVGFIAEARNIVLVAPQGLAKTMIAHFFAPCEPTSLASKPLYILFCQNTWQSASICVFAIPCGAIAK